MKKKIMIVEDENIIALDLKHRILKLDYQVAAVVSSGEEAIDKVKEVSPDLILMDILLKGKKDGVDTAKVIVSKSNIPVVFISSYSDDAILSRAQSISPHGYLIKPFTQSELQNKIEEIFSNYDD